MALTHAEATVNSLGKPLLLVMQVQIGKGVSDQILFAEGDDIESVVHAFVKTHSLGMLNSVL
jgi:hypothetical protein